MTSTTMNSTTLATTHMPSTQNETWGFWGTMNEHAASAWPIAMTAIAQATDQTLESVRIFLDSRHGRHFADDVQNGLYEGKALADAIHATTERWMGWTTGRLTSKQYGIPKGMPYLTGFVIHCTIVDEVLAD